MTQQEKGVSTQRQDAADYTAPPVTHVFTYRTAQIMTLLKVQQPRFVPLSTTRLLIRGG